MEIKKLENKRHLQTPLSTKKKVLNLKKCAITSNKFYSHKKNNINNNNKVYYTMGNTISEYYYKNPFFYNDNNLNMQLKVLKELKKLYLSQNSTTTPTNSNTKNNSPSPMDKKLYINNISKNIEEKSIKKNKVSYMNINLPNIPKIHNKDSNIKIEINDKGIKDDIDEDEDEEEIKKAKRKNYKSLEHKIHSGEKVFMKRTPQKIRENDEYFYKIVFKTKPLFKLEQKMVIDNKLNMIYAENEQQYKNIIEKEYKRLISQGKKVKSKNVAPSIKLKLNEAKNRIQFMKGIMDYSYPGFVLSKIKIMQKRLNAHKSKASYLNCLNEMEIRTEEQKKRDKNRKDYLLKCITILK
jgi:hypothetical protein